MAALHFHVGLFVSYTAMKYRLNKEGEIVASGRGAEDNLQRACVQWFDTQYPRLRLSLYHIPNQTVNAIECKKKIGMGMREGVADLHLTIPNHGLHSLYIEIKTPVGVQSRVQKDFEASVTAQGHGYVICRDVDQFIKAVQIHLHGLPCYKDLWGIQIPFPQGSGA